MLVSNEWLGLIKVIDFSLGVSQVIPFIQSPEHWRQEVRGSQEEELRHVENIQEFGSVPDIEPHPISVRLQSHGFQSEDFQEVRASARVPMVA